MRAFPPLSSPAKTTGNRRTPPSPGHRAPIPRLCKAPIPFSKPVPHLLCGNKLPAEPKLICILSVPKMVSICATNVEFDLYERYNGSCKPVPHLLCGNKLPAEPKLICILSVPKMVSICATNVEFDLYERYNGSCRLTIGAMKWNMILLY